MSKIWIYKPPHGYFKGLATKKISPCVNSSAWVDNTFAIWIEPQKTTPDHTQLPTTKS